MPFATPRPCGPQPSSSSPSRRALSSLSLSTSTSKASRTTRSLFAAFTPRRPASSQRPRSKDEAAFLSALPVLLSGPAQAYVLAAEAAKARASGSEERVEWAGARPGLERSMSVWSADSVEVGGKEGSKVLTKRRHVRSKSFSSTTSSATSSTSASPSTHRAPATPPKTPNLTRTLTSTTLPINPLPVPPKTPRSPRARTSAGRKDLNRPTFAEFLAELDPSIQTMCPASLTKLPPSPPATPPSTAPRSLRSAPVFPSRRAVRRAEGVPAVPKLRIELVRKYSSPEEVDAHYWSPTLEAIDWSNAADKKAGAKAPTGLGVEMVVLERGAHVDGEFPIIVAKGLVAPRSKEAMDKALRRGINIQGKSGGAKANGRSAVALASQRVAAGGARPWEFL